MDTRTTVEPQRYRILLIGKTGNGKSSLGNTILGREEFRTGRSMSSTTLRAQSEVSSRSGIEVVDTPDLINMDTDDTAMQHEVSQWKKLTLPAPSAILIVIRYDVRYTAEEHEVYRKIKELWGSGFTDRLVVAFTFGDRQDCDIKEELKTVCRELQNVLRDAKWRYVVFDNTARDKDTQVDHLLNCVHKMETEHPQPFQKVLELLYFLVSFVWVCVFPQVVQAFRCCLSCMRKPIIMLCEELRKLLGCLASIMVIAYRASPEQIRALVDRVRRQIVLLYQQLRNFL